ncbi:MAG TPA: alpha/beta hydrolase [Terriglobales bacterium]|nr:alpha/beta hydrolase [Terriglobales bacterium]
MPYFIDVRADSAGGNPVGSVDAIVVRTDAQQNPNPSAPLDPQLIQAVQGRDVLLGTHGFHVNRASGISYLTHWNEWLRLGDNGLFVGVLWPGDSRWLPFLDYPAEGSEAIKSGRLLAAYLEKYFTGANTLSFSSHSLGARMVLETIRNLPDSTKVQRVTLMAGAIDDTCLNGEYRDAAARVGKISVLASSCDEVLKLAFPLGNPISGILTRGDPYWHGALGRYGPNPADQPLNLWKSPNLPESWNFGHASYIDCSGPVAGPPAESGPFFPPALVVPPAGTPCPSNSSNWQQAWAAGFVSTRFY